MEYKFTHEWKDKCLASQRDGKRREEEEGGGGLAVKGGEMI